MDTKIKTNNLYENLHHNLHNLVNKHKTLDRLSRNFGFDETLIGCEIHMIETIGNNSMSNITEVASKLGVTKAAASQTIGKLHLSGFIRKLKDEDNRREVYLALTEKGLKAHQGHREVWENNCSKFLTDLTDEQINNFNKVAEKISLLVTFEIESYR